MIIPLTGVQAQGVPGDVAMSIDGPHRSEMTDFVRGRSQSRRLAEGTIEVTVQDRPRRGRPNEPYVLKVLAEALGHVETRAQTEAEDKNGFDGFVKLPGACMWTGVQTVSVPADSAYAAATARGDITIVLSYAQAAKWIADAIEHKVGGHAIAPADRSGLILALDIRHAGLLADDQVVAAFNADFPDAAQRGFASVWLVASAAVRCRRLA